jgi:hypothetical protein
MKKIIIYIITIFLLISIVSAFNLDFWYTSQLEASWDGGVIYVPTNSQYEVDGCGSGTVLDKEFDLCWQADGNNFTGTHANAITHCTNLNLGDSSERTWRLPNVQEWSSLVSDSCTSRCGTTFINALNGFDNFTNSNYWTSTTYGRNTSNAMYYHLSSNYVINIAKTTATNKAVCVADYHELFPLKIDGCGLNTVLDSMTETCFMRNWTIGGSKNWTDAIDYCRNLALCNDGTYVEGGDCSSNGGVYNDVWDLPTRHEMLRVVDYGLATGPVIVGGNNNIFQNVQSSSYWTSSRYSSSHARRVGLSDGFVSSVGVANAYRVVCVSRS